MKRLIAMSLLVILSACNRDPTAEKPDGAENYALMCAGCHDPGPGHPGTMLLEQAGRPVASLFGRDDLDREYLRTIVRQGLIEMPPFRPTELSDAEIDEIYAHIMSAEPPVTTPAMPVK